MSRPADTPDRHGRPHRVPDARSPRHTTAGHPRADASDLHGATLVLLRHGESTHHAAGLVSGSCDPDLTRAGREAARRAGNALRRAGLVPDRVWVSTLNRARETATLTARAGGFPDSAVAEDARLDERNYGAYNGRRKSELVDEVGYEGYLRLRRDVGYRPPPMPAATRERPASLRGVHDPVPDRRSGAESLTDVTDRVASFYRERLLPALALTCRAVLIVAHGDSLRALCSVVDGLDHDELRELTIPAGIPLIYRFDWLLRAETRGGRQLPPPDWADTGSRPHSTPENPR